MSIPADQRKLYEERAKFAFGYSEKPGVVCRFCQRTDGQFCLNLYAAALCLEHENGDPKIVP